MLQYLGYKHFKPTAVHEDNAAAIAVTDNERVTKRVRHVDMQYFAILEWVQRGDIVLKHIKTTDNPADGLTNPLPH